MVLAIVLVAFFALALGFLAGVTIDLKPNAFKKQIKLKKEIAEIEKEYQNFLNYDGTIQE